MSIKYLIIETKLISIVFLDPSLKILQISKDQIKIYSKNNMILKTYITYFT